jgi:fumarate reductase subunit C
MNEMNYNGYVERRSNTILVPAHALKLLTKLLHSSSWAASHPAVSPFNA